MARAELFVPPPISPPTEIRLTLSQDEARVLHLVTGQTSGSSAGWGGEAYAIYRALHKVVSNPLSARDVLDDLSQLDFKPTKE